MKKDIVIFDLDGTLLNTLEGLKDSFNYAIGVFGYPKRSVEEVKAFVGDGVKKAIERCLPCVVCEGELNEIYKTFKTYYEENITRGTFIYEGMLDELIELKKQEYKICVVSNKYDSAVKEVCELYFSDIVDIAVGESADVAKKPSVDGIKKVLKEIGGSLDRALFVGDSQVDIQTAKNAGIECISVLWGYRTREELVQAGGTCFIEHPNELIKKINELNEKSF